MPNSARFRALSSRLAGLKDRLIPDTKPSGNYTVRENDLIRAYRLMAHAEFESYFEDRAIQIARNAKTLYMQRGKSGRALVALMTFSQLATQPIPKTLATLNFDDPIARVNKVVLQFTNEVRIRNHGIREGNLLAMLYPIGIRRVDIDATFLNTIDSYGQNRGASAHQSIRVQQPIDPVIEVTMVDNLLIELRKLDLKLQRLIG